MEIFRQQRISEGNQYSSFWFFCMLEQTVTLTENTV